MTDLKQQLLDRSKHCRERAEQLEEKWETGKHMETNECLMMQKYRQLANAYALVIQDQKKL
jgi:uncharacterized coiled-coil DUF342 family protein